MAALVMAQNRAVGSLFIKFWGIIHMEYWLTCKIGHLKQEEANALEDAIRIAALRMDVEVDIKTMYLGMDLAKESQEKHSI